MDAHCEAEPNWLPPLVTPILNDYRTCTVPLIDAIDGSKYTFTEQAGGDSDGFARGAWDWALNWKRIPLPKKEKAHRIHKTENYRFGFIRKLIDVGFVRWYIFKPFITQCKKQSFVLTLIWKEI